MKHLTPNNGGCWFCSQDECDRFSTEFDTYLHEACLRKAAEHPDDPEAAIMFNELLK